jgi:hypothetical protein
MAMTPQQRQKTLAIRDNSAGSEDVRAKASHALDHDDAHCLECCAWRGRPVIFHAGASDFAAELSEALSGEATVTSDPIGCDRLARPED